MAEYELDVLVRAEISDPVPGEHAFDADNQVISIIGNHLEQGLWRGFDIFVNGHLPGIIEDTHVQGARMQVNSAGITVLLGIESRRVFSYGCGDLPVYRFGGKLEGKAQ
jgi:hypothetical protein